MAARGAMGCTHVVVSVFRKRRNTGARDDHGDPSANQIGRQRRQPVVLTLRPAVFDRYGLALDIAGVFEALTKSAQALRHPVRRLAKLRETFGR
jgi:hypothetical protein